MALSSWLWVALVALVVAGLARTVELVAAHRDWVKATEHDGSKLAERVQTTAWMFLRVTFESVMRVLVATVVVVIALASDDPEQQGIALTVGVIALCIIDLASTVLGRVYRAHVIRIGL